VQVFAPDAKDPQLALLLQLLQKSREKYKDKEMKAFSAFWAEKPETLEKLNRDLKIDGVALTLLKGPKDPALESYSVNTQNRTTVIVYKNRKVTASFVNYNDKKDAARLQQALEAVGR
jgi:selenocysteine lyase/cysteine desulfurase